MRRQALCGRTHHLSLPPKDVPALGFEGVMNLQKYDCVLRGFAAACTYPTYRAFGQRDTHAQQTTVAAALCGNFGVYGMPCKNS